MNTMPVIIKRLGSGFDDLDPYPRLSLSFAKSVMMSSAPAKSAGDARYASQDPFTVPYDLVRNQECVLSTSNAISALYNP